MSTIGTIYVGDVGTQITLTLKDEFGAVISIVGATTKDIVILSAVASVGQGIAKAGSYTDGTGANGQLRYTTIAGDINAPGVWSAQMHIVIGALDFRSSEVSFAVQEAL